MPARYFPPPFDGHELLGRFRWQLLHGFYHLRRNLPPPRCVRGVQLSFPYFNHPGGTVTFGTQVLSGLHLGFPAVHAGKHLGNGRQGLTARQHAGYHLVQLERVGLGV